MNESGSAPLLKIKSGNPLFADFFLFMPLYALHKQSLSPASQQSLMMVCSSQTHPFRLVAPFPLKVLRLSGTPESPPGLFGERKSKGTSEIFTEQVKWSMWTLL